MRILIAEQHALFRTGIAGLIKITRPDWELTQAVDLADAQRCLGITSFTVLLVGGCLLNARDLRHLRGLRADFPAVKVIVRADNPGREALVAYFSAGAHGCITDQASATDIERAICCVASGDVIIPAALVDLDPATISHHAPGLVGRPARCLTHRQNEVLDLLGKGQTTKEIARSLELSVATIKTHLAALYRAVGARNRVEAAVKAGHLAF